MHLLRLIALGAPLWLFALLLPGGWLAGLAYFVLLAALCWRDVTTIPRASELRARRQLPPRFALDVDHSVTLVLTNRTALALLASVRDELPEVFESRNELPPVRHAADGEARLSYTVRPLNRGAHTFGDVILRVQGQHGLIAAANRRSRSGHGQGLSEFSRRRSVSTLGANRPTR